MILQNRKELTKRGFNTFAKKKKKIMKIVVDETFSVTISLDVLCTTLTSAIKIFLSKRCYNFIEDNLINFFFIMFIVIQTNKS